MVILIVVIIIVSLFIIGLLCGSQSTLQNNIPVARTRSQEATRRNHVGLEVIDSDKDTLLAKIHSLSAQGYCICFDDEVLLENPDLLSQLSENVKVSIAKDIIDTLEGYSKTAKYGFKVKQILSVLMTRAEKKICHFDGFYLRKGEFSPDKIEDRVIGAYLKDQNSNLHYNILISKRPEWCSIASRNGLNILLVK
ncbi:hypothetical protein [Paenibacillus periandrae]|uniref:hypothetical protein n=1 Tax=Paenibacillus periandrae TaxID=1761741 RepID=UPI001F096E41|nr:hypothetical protein [Paenibacillus periandrae]